MTRTTRVTHSFKVFYTHVHFLEILKTSVNNDVTLIRPQHRGHVHLEANAVILM